MSDTITYQLQYRISGTTQWSDYGIPITGTSETVIGLSPNYSYDFQVIASNAAGSVISPIATIITPGNSGGLQIVIAFASAAGILTSTSNVINSAAAMLNGSGTLIAYGYSNSIRSTISASGSITVSAGIVSNKTVLINGNAGTSAIATEQMSVGSAVQANASVSVSMLSTHMLIGSVAISATGGVSAQIYRTSYAGVILNAVGSVTVITNVMHLQQWSSTHKFANVVLSNNALTATEATTVDDSAVYALTSAIGNSAPGAATGVTVVSDTQTSVTLSWTAPATVGSPNKYYWEIVIFFNDATMISVGIGNINASVASGAWVGKDTNSLGWMISSGILNTNQVNVLTGNAGPTNPVILSDTVTATTATLTWQASAPPLGTWPSYTTSGTRLCFALDLVNNLIWGRVANGLWSNSATANPATATGGFLIPASVLTAAMSPGCTLNAIGDYCIGYFSSSIWTYAAPSGFESWDLANNPTAPANVTASSIASTTLTITWTAS
jgi:hypothetical protein